MTIRSSSLGCKVGWGFVGEIDHTVFMAGARELPFFDGSKGGGSAVGDGRITVAQDTHKLGHLLCMALWGGRQPFNVDGNVCGQRYGIRMCEQTFL